MNLIDKVRGWRAYQAGLKTFKEITTPFRKIDPDENSWVSVGGKARRDLGQWTQDQMSEVAFRQWLTDPLAGRIVEILTDFIVGDGVVVKAEDENVQEIIDEFWYDEVNDMDGQQLLMAPEFTIFGELVLVPYINPISGIVQFARLDPIYIKDVVPDPQFPQVSRAVLLKKSSFTDPTGNPLDTLRIIHKDRDPRSRTAGQSVGDCFYFAQGKIASKRRGHTQLLRTHEWIDIHGKRLFNEAERQELASNYVWDVTLKGAGQAAVQEFIDKTDTPQPASIRAHNEEVEWNVLTPDLKAQDFAESNRQFLQEVLGAYGIPEHWFALGGDVNFATAKAMSEPTLRSFKRQQRGFVTIIEKMIDYQIERAQLAKRIPKGEVEYEVIADEISSVDMQTIASAITSIASALSIAESQGWTQKHEAADAFSKLFSQTGSEIEPIQEGEEQIPPQLAQLATQFQKATEGIKKRRKKRYASY